MTETLTGVSADRLVKTAEQRVRMLLECVRLPAVALDETGSILFANEELLKVSGFDADDLIGRSWVECLVPQRDRVIVKAALDELRRSGTHLHFDSALLTKTGEERLIAWSNAAFFGTSGAISETISIGEDITQRRLLETELAATREREGAVSQELADSRERERAAAQEIAAARERERAALEDLAASRDRERAAVRDVDAAREREREAVRELDAVRQREREAVRELDAAREREREAVRELDAERATGVEREAAAERAASADAATSEAEQRAAEQACRAEEEARRAAEQARRAEEQERRAEEQTRRAEDEARRARDEARRAEEAAHRAEEEERRAQEQARRAEEEARRAEDEARRAEEAERRRDQEKHRADAATQATSELLDAIGTGIRLPLERIIEMGGVLLDAPLGPEQRRCAETLRGSSERLLTLMNDLVDIARIQTGSLALGSINFDVRETVENVVAGLQAEAEQRHVDLTTLIHCEVPALLRGDAGRIRQLLTSLAIRALRSTRRGEVTVSVDLDACSEQTASVRFTVADTGSGLGPEQRKRLFDVPAEAETTGKHAPGAALGLALASRLVQAMGGQLTSDSDPSFGSFCSFSLPLAIPANQPRPREAVRDDVSVLAGQRVLIVDASRVGRAAAARRLVEIGCEVMLADAGQDAIRLLVEGVRMAVPARVCIVSSPLPDMDDKSFCTAVRQDAGLDDLPLVVLSSSGLRGDAARCEAAGFNAYYAKPVTSDELAACLVRLLSSDGLPSGLLTRHSLRADAAVVRKHAVLLASKKATQRKAFARALDQSLCRVQVASSQQEFTDALGRLRFEVAIVDLELPGLDWNAIARALAAQTGAKTAIVALGSGGSAERSATLDRGAQGYLPRTAPAADLCALVMKLLDQTDGGGA